MPGASAAALQGRRAAGVRELGALPALRVAEEELRQVALRASASAIGSLWSPWPPIRMSLMVRP